MVDNANNLPWLWLKEKVDENDNVIGEAYPFEFALVKKVIMTSWYGLEDFSYGNHCR